MKIKKRLRRYDINEPRSRHGHKYSRCKNCLSVMMLICIKQNLSNIWTSIHEKVKRQALHIKRNIRNKNDRKMELWETPEWLSVTEEHLEAVARRCSVKKIFLRTSQINLTRRLSLEILYSDWTRGFWALHSHLIRHYLSVASINVYCMQKTNILHLLRHEQIVTSPATPNQTTSGRTSVICCFDDCLLAYLQSVQFLYQILRYCDLNNSAIWLEENVWDQERKSLKPRTLREI